MKQHSYAFYNGYLWNTLEDLHKVEGKIKKLDGKQSDQNLDELRDFLKEELELQSITVRFPENISFKNYFEYSMFPTVVYQ